MSVRDLIAEMLRGWDARECYPSCCVEKQCKYCREADARADAILAIEVEGREIHADGCNLTVELCPYPDREYCDCDELADSRPATIGDLICDNYKKEE
jgi:hypothetical protein